MNRFLILVSIVPVVIACQSLSTTIPNKALLETRGPKAYIQNIQYTDRNLRGQADRVNNVLLMRLMEASRDRFIFMSEDSVAAILKQVAMQSQGFGSDEDVIIRERIGSLADFDILVAGSISGTPEVLSITVRAFKLNADRSEFRVFLSETAQLRSFQLDFYLAEIAKKFNQPEYRIALLNIPSTPSVTLQLTPLAVTIPEPVEPKLPSDEQLAGQSMKGLVQAMQEYIAIGRKAYLEKDYRGAEKQFMAVLKSIEALTPAQQRALTGMKSVLLQYLQSAISQQFVQKVTAIDERLPFKQNSQAQLDDVRRFLSDYRRVCAEFMQYRADLRNSSVEKTCSGRIETLQLAEWNLRVNLAEESFQNLELESAVSSLEGIIKETESEKTGEPDGKARKAIRDQLKQRLKSMEERARQYVHIQTTGFLEIAEAENARAILERELDNPQAVRYHKAIAMNSLGQTARTIKSHRRFATPALIRYYQAIAVSVDEDNRKSIDISLENIALLPFRYVYNVSKNITDIFRLRFGYGVGVGGEIGVIGGSAGLARFSQRSYSTAHQDNEQRVSLAMHPLHKHWITSDYFIAGGMGIPVALSNCYSTMFLRLCSTALQYTNINLWLGLGPAAQINIETHRIVELFGTLLFQDWQVLPERRYRRQYFGHGHIEMLD
jgi:hypothetical protein